ncbi:MAG: phosphoribosylanthranilate isomerase [Candidatus Electrothrix aestuarii]|uniref:N-(5'-phosphoribosyl)anthranilate isomerase n=1 Tax=Candidatus Electrothrix aestuarii TaxID=3062594 RepID=A0AAU8M031_9BACT|nr:phosphoribosylanthranilate isomerase [Candidatus Electrothrix aestuarii]
MNVDRIRIKMCGITNLEDATAAVDAGVDALGFIFYEKSPRNIDPEVARIIIEQLPPFVSTVGVFVDRKRQEVEEIIRFCRLGYAQLHGQESPKYCERLTRFAAPCQVIKALRVGEHLQASDITPYNDHVKGFLLDTYQKGVKGGTGQRFDWSLIQGLKLQRDFILAGGLDAESVREAVENVSPYALDVNSGVEASPGQKDYSLIKKFIRQVRACETS